MQKIKISLFMSVILLAGCASTEVKKSEQSSKPIKTSAAYMDNNQLNSMLVGKTMSGDYQGSAWSAKMNSDGTLIGSDQAGGDTGTYKIQNGLFCSKYKVWGSGSNQCYKIQKREKDFYAKAVSGGGNSYSFKIK